MSFLKINLLAIWNLCFIKLKGGSTTFGRRHHTKFRSWSTFLRKFDHWLLWKRWCKRETRYMERLTTAVMKSKKREILSKIWLIILEIILMHTVIYIFLPPALILILVDCSEGKVRSLISQRLSDQRLSLWQKKSKALVLKFNGTNLQKMRSLRCKNS